MPVNSSEVVLTGVHSDSGAGYENSEGNISNDLGRINFGIIMKMKGFKKVGAEMSLHVLAYNLKRVMKIIGTVPLMEAMRA